MTDYSYTDKDGDSIEISKEFSLKNTAYLDTDGCDVGIYIPAEEAPKTAQALLDASGVQGTVLTDLPKVIRSQLGGYEATGFTSYHQSDLNKLEKEAKALIAIWLRHKADEAEREAGLAKVREEADRLAAEKKAHDELRTSPIAMKALALYNRVTKPMRPYTSWDATNDGCGASDFIVKEYIEQAEQEGAKEKEAAEKLAARRDAIIKDVFGVNFYYEGYSAGAPLRKAVDRIIELEDGK